MKQKKNRALLAAMICLLAGQLFAQNVLLHSGRFGLNIGANLAFGTHFQRLGINFNFLYVNNRFQASSEVRTYFNFKNLGPEKMYPEMVLAQGVLFAYGYYTEYGNPFFTSVSNQTGRSNSIAYSYNFYFNKIKTTQQTGIVALQFHNVSIITENDLLAKPSLDRFRTGAFLVQYQYRDQFQAGINCTLWTGKMGNRINLDPSDIRAGCYMDTANGVYSTLSHGLLSAQFKYYTGRGQNVQASAGVDAEQVRDAVQNRFMHDMIFLPEKWRTKNCHIPMIDNKGEQFIYREGQAVKKPKLYLNAFSNASLFY